MSGFIGLVNQRGAPTARESLQAMISGQTGPDPQALNLLSSADGVMAVAFWDHPQHGRRMRYYASGALQPSYIILGDIINDEFADQATVTSYLQTQRLESAEWLTSLNGSYLLIGFNPTDSQLLISSDRTASQPLYVLQTSEGLAFATELRYLLRTPGYHSELNIQGLASFLGCGFILAGETLATGIRLLGPAEFISISRQGIQQERYLEFKFAAERERRGTSELADELSGLIIKAVERRLRGNDHIAVLLSGGYDSRTLLGCVQKLRPDRRLTTVTWGEEKDDPESDAAIAAELATQLKTRHTFYPLHAEALPDHFRDFVIYGEGRTDAVGNYPEALRIFQRIRDELQVHQILRGDEFFGWKRNVHNTWEALHSMDIHSLRWLENHYSYLRPNWRQDLVELSSVQLQRLIQNCPYQDVHDQKDYLYFTQRFWGYLNPLSQLKQRVVGLVNPFLDADILDFMARVPTALRLDKALFRATARSMFPNLNWTRMATHHNLIDWDRRLIKDRRLQEFVRHILLDTQNGLDQIWEPAQLRGFLERAFSEKTTGAESGWRRLRRALRPGSKAFRLNAHTEIFRLMILKIWVEEFLGGNLN